MKRLVAASTFLVHSRVLFMIDRTTAQIEVVMKSLGGLLPIYNVSIYIPIYMYLSPYL